YSYLPIFYLHSFPTRRSSDLSFMFIKYGTGNAKIKTYTDQLQPCKSCRAFDRTIKVYQSYYHFWYIPFVAKPGKTALIRCNNCRSEEHTSELQSRFDLVCRLL